MAAVPELVPSAGDRGLLAHAGYVLRENPLTAFAFAMFAIIVLAALLGPALAPYDPLESDAARALQAPSAAQKLRCSLGARTSGARSQDSRICPSPPTRTATFYR